MSHREGSTSQGEFWETLKHVSNAKLPVVMWCRKRLRISTPVEVNTPGGNISRWCQASELHFVEVDGRTLSRALPRCARR